MNTSALGCLWAASDTLQHSTAKQSTAQHSTACREVQRAKMPAIWHVTMDKVWATRRDTMCHHHIHPAARRAWGLPTAAFLAIKRCQQPPLHHSASAAACTTLLCITSHAQAAYTGQACCLQATCVSNHRLLLQRSNHKRGLPGGGPWQAATQAVWLSGPAANGPHLPYMGMAISWSPKKTFWKPPLEPGCTMQATEGVLRPVQVPCPM